jgi:hypothetical protein
MTLHERDINLTGKLEDTYIDRIEMAIGTLQLARENAAINGNDIQQKEKQIFDRLISYSQTAPIELREGIKVKISPIVGNLDEIYAEAAS